MPSRPGLTVLLADLSPIIGLGLSRLLEEQGARPVVGRSTHRGLLVQARRLRPDVLVIGTAHGKQVARALAERLSNAAPWAKVILWAVEQQRIELIGVGAAPSRPVADDGLIAEIVGRHATEHVEPV